MTSRLTTIALASVLAIALAIPSAAGALPKFTESETRSPAVVGAAATSPRERAAARFKQKAADLGKRIETALSRRDATFGAASAKIGSRITTVGTIADKVSAAGGDVSGVRNALAKAKEQLDSANALEQQAVEKFKAVPAATDKRATFLEARALGKQAGDQLRIARATLRDAIQQLRVVIRQIKQDAKASGAGVATP